MNDGDDSLKPGLDIRVRTYELHTDGSLEPLSDYSFASYGTCPNVGDTICAFRFTGTLFYSVVRRYYIDMEGWAVVLRMLEPNASMERVVKAWDEDVRFWAKIEREEAEAEKARRERAGEELLATLTTPAKPEKQKKGRATTQQPKSKRGKYILTPKLGRPKKD